MTVTIGTKSWEELLSNVEVFGFVVAEYLGPYIQNAQQIIFTAFV